MAKTLFLVCFALAAVAFGQGGLTGIWSTGVTNGCKTAVQINANNFLTVNGGGANCGPFAQYGVYNYGPENLWVDFPLQIKNGAVPNSAAHIDETYVLTGDTLNIKAVNPVIDITFTRETSTAPAVGVFVSSAVDADGYTRVVELRSGIFIMFRIKATAADFSTGTTGGIWGTYTYTAGTLSVSVAAVTGDLASVYSQGQSVDFTMTGVSASAFTFDSIAFALASSNYDGIWIASDGVCQLTAQFDGATIRVIFNCPGINDDGLIVGYFTQGAAALDFFTVQDDQGRSWDHSILDFVGDPASGKIVKPGKTSGSKTEPEIPLFKVTAAPAALEVAITLDGSIDTFDPLNFITEFAATVNCKASQVEVLGFSAGSIIVDVRIQSDVDPSGASAEDIFTALQAAPTIGNYPVVGVEATTPVPTAANMPSDAGLDNGGGRGNGDKRFIVTPTGNAGFIAAVTALGALVGVFALFLAIQFILSQHKSE